MTQQYLLTYFDILGYEKIVTKMLKNPDLMQSIRDLLFTSTQGLQDRYKAIPRNSGFGENDQRAFTEILSSIKVRIVSDSIIYTMPLTDREGDFLKASLHTYFNCIVGSGKMFIAKTGCLLRGCIAKGKHYEESNDPNFLFFASEPLINAYRKVEKEKNEDFPTAIIVHPDLWPWIESNIDKQYVSNHFIKNGNYTILNWYINLDRSKHSKNVVADIARGVTANYMENKANQEVLKKIKSFSDIHNQQMDLLKWPELRIELR